jgi:serine/threonine protein phosphatase PrpC
MGVSADIGLRCEACAALRIPHDRFCEACGTRVGAEPTEEDGFTRDCHGCGAPASAIDADGYCSVCGVRERTGQGRVELDLSVAAAVTDRGRVRRRNEDAFHLQRVGGDVVAVVCDGISTAVSADLAANRAAAAAGAVLADALRDGSPAPAAATTKAVVEAQVAVGQLAPTSAPDLTDPSCTLVSALVCADGLVIGWVGDSRAYWITPDDSYQLTADHSWASEQIAAGLLSAEQAASDRRAHAITRWVGPDAPDDPPQLVTVRPTAPGRLVLCTDGLWNYTPEAAALAKLLSDLPAAASAAAAARSLADTALASGGQDNITVAVADVRPQRRQQT